jgi:hypothetical protein
MNGELFTTGAARPHDCETHTTQLMGAWLQKLTDRMTEHIRQAMETRRHSGGEYEPDFGDRLRKLEGLQHDPSIHITNGGGSEPPKWLTKYILGVGIALTVSAITTTATTIVIVASLSTKVDDYIKANNERVSRVEKQADETQRRLDRGAGT